MNPENYHLEFYEDGERQPVRAWLEELDESEPAKHDALVYALTEVLARQGTNVCETEFGKTLGKGLFEFRLRHTRDELQAKVQPHLDTAEGSSAEPTKVLLRVFFAVYGDKIVLLLAGYDKGRDPSPRRQNKEISEARKRLKAHQSRLAAEAKAETGAATSGTGARGRGGRSAREATPEAATRRAERRVPAERSFLMWFRRRRRKQAKSGRSG